MSEQVQTRAAKTSTFLRTNDGVLQRKCACGGTPGPTGECENCRKKREVKEQTLQRVAVDSSPVGDVPPIVHDVLQSPGQPLDRETREFMESRFGHDLSQVRLHTDEKAVESAKAVNALAYTVGKDIIVADQHYPSHDYQSLYLLAHELAHTLQQNVMPNTIDHLQIAPSNSLSEQQADAAATSALSEQQPKISSVSGNPQLAKRGPMPAPVRPPPVRSPARAPSGTLSPGSPAPSGGTYQEPMWLPDQFDNSLEAALQRSAIRDYAERERIRQEQPVATLERGGKAPTFITEHGTRNHAWLGGPSGGGSVTVRNRKFHVLDAIEHEVSQANTEQELQRILQDYVPSVALINEAIDMSKGRSSRLSGIGGPVLKPFWDMPLYPQGLDPRGQTRLQVFESALNQRIEKVPALAQSRLRPQSKRRKGCRIEPIDPLGGDPMSVLYCHLATGSPYSYKITLESGTGAATQRWAEIDSLRGDTWYECKCGYEALLTGAARGEGVARAVLDKLDKQVLNHVDIARTCGLQYRYIVSNNRVADMLRERWFGNVVIDVVPFEGCD